MRLGHNLFRFFHNEQVWHWLSSDDVANMSQCTYSVLLASSGVEIHMGDLGGLFFTESLA